MPLLALEWNTKGDHLVVDDLGGDDIAVASLSWDGPEEGGRHRILNIVVDLAEIASGQSGVDRVISLLVDRHTPNIVEKLRVLLRGPEEEGAVVLRLPF